MAKCQIYPICSQPAPSAMNNFKRNGGIQSNHTFLRGLIWFLCGLIQRCLQDMVAKNVPGTGIQHACGVEISKTPDFFQVNSSMQLARIHCQGKEGQILSSEHCLIHRSTHMRILILRGLSLEFWILHSPTTSSTNFYPLPSLHLP